MLAGITDRAGANRHLTEVYPPAFNAEFMQPAMEEGSAFVGSTGGPLGDVLGERLERTVGNDNGVSFDGMTRQIPADCHRCCSARAKVTMPRRIDNTPASLHGPRKLAHYDQAGNVMPPNSKVAASVPPDQGGQFMCYKTGQFYLLPTEVGALLRRTIRRQGTRPGCQGCAQRKRIRWRSPSATACPRQITPWSCSVNSSRWTKKRAPLSSSR